MTATATKPTLTRRPAPPFWTRWVVTGPGGATLGLVEKRGGSAPWRALDADGHVVGSWFRTKAAAVAALIGREVRRG